MSIQNEIDRIETAKEGIAEALGNLGVTIPTGTSLSAFPDYISSIVLGMDAADYDADGAVKNAGGIAAYLAAHAPELLFYCEYGTTTFAQITAALDAGKLPVCLYDGYFYSYTGTYNSNYCFTCFIITNARRLTATPSNAWSSNSYTVSQSGHTHIASDIVSGTFNKSMVGLSNVDNVRQYSSSNPPPYPVTSINGNTGEVNLTASDLNALPLQGTIGSSTDISNLTVGMYVVNTSGRADFPTTGSYYGALIQCNGNYKPQILITNRIYTRRWQISASEWTEWNEEYIKPSSGIPGTDLTDASVIRAKLANDALYSPIKNVSTQTYTIVADDLGKTIRLTYNGAVTITLSNTVMDAFPIGTEITFMRGYISGSTKKFSIVAGSNYYLETPGTLGSKGRTLTCSSAYELVAIKKVSNDEILATGNFD